MNKLEFVLYHGSYQFIDNPSVDKSSDKTDFGKGFYLTTDREQAENWSLRKALNNANGVVTAFKVNALIFNQLSILTLNPDKFWIELLLLNRKTFGNKDQQLQSVIKAKMSMFDIIYGPMADGKIYPVLKRYIRGKISLEKAIKLINPHHYSEQFCFKNDKALRCLTCIGKEIVPLCPIVSL